MANARLGNVIYIDSTGLVGAGRNTRVIGILYTSSAAGDAVVLRESSGGSNKISIKNGVATDTKHIPLEESPIIFGEDIYVQSISASSVLMLIVSQSGAT